ncbi:MAG TPA: efflux transporter outer membrane subunit [Gemmatimonadaceae bacterium]|jgi:multidrug efflux system outer membrane protein
MMPKPFSANVAVIPSEARNLLKRAGGQNRGEDRRSLLASLVGMTQVALVGAAALLGACTAGPRYTPETVIPADEKIGVSKLSDSSRQFFDSLAVERRRDSVQVVPPPASRTTLSDASVSSVAWLDIIRDTTLVKLVQTAMLQNRDLQVAVARINEYRADVGVARGPLLPSVALNGSESTNQVALGAFPPTSYRAARFTGDVAWELDFWGRVRRGVEAANADLGAQEAAQRATALSLVSDVASGYLQLLELDQERAIAERTLSSRKATLDIARQRFAQGLTSELDVRQFEAQVAAPAVTLAQTQRAQAQAEHNLDVLLGEGAAPIPRGTSLADAVAALVVPDSVSAALLARRPDVVQAERSYAASVARIGVADASRFPTFNIVGSLGSQAGAPSDVFGSQTRVYQAQIGFSFPLFDNKRLASASAAARARAEQARASYEGVTLNAVREANDALTAVRTARDEAVAQATQATALRQALDLATVRYQAGLSSYLDLLDAERSLFGAELAVSQAQLGELTAAVQLYKALGGAWPARP